MHKFCVKTHLTGNGQCLSCVVIDSCIDVVVVWLLVLRFEKKIYLDCKLKIN